MTDEFGSIESLFKWPPSIVKLATRFWSTVGAYKNGKEMTNLRLTWCTLKVSRRTEDPSLYECCAGEKFGEDAASIQKENVRFWKSNAIAIMYML